MKIIFGSRGSDLALTQTRMVMNRLQAAHPGVELELRIIKTTGDNKPEARLEEIGGLGAFTREIEIALLDGEIDAAIHSLKDLPTHQPEGLRVAAVAGRERPNDALVASPGQTLETLPHGAVVGTSSLRRKAQLLALRPDLRIEELRGNVPTRMAKVGAEGLDAVILAAAGLRRLQLFEKPGISEIPLARMLPAPGQGALAVETRTDDTERIALLAALHDEAAAVATACERAVLQAFGGGCRAPLGAFAYIESGTIHLCAFAANMETGVTCRIEQDAPVQEAERLGAETGSALFARVGQASCTAAAPPPLPLQNRRILITRPQAQTASLEAIFIQSGAECLCVPLIEIETLLDAPLPDANTPFDWLVFTSANAVHSFAALLMRHDRSPDAYASCRVAAIGEATAAAARDAGFAVHVTPTRHVADALVEAIAADDPDPAGKCALLPLSDQARPVVAEGLRGLGMQVHCITAYRNRPCPLSQSDIAAVATFAPDCVAFFSPSAVAAYVNGGLRDGLAHTSCPPVHASIGPVTTDALRREKCPNIVEAAQQNECALCDAVIAAFHHANPPGAGQAP